MAVAYPFVDITLDESGLAQTIQRAPGVVAIVGTTGGDGTAAAEAPIVIGSLSEALPLFNDATADPIVETPLYKGLRAVLNQNPGPSKVYAVKIDGTDWAGGLAALEAADDVTIVALAGATLSPGENTAVLALKNHVESQSSDGNKRIGVAHYDTTQAKSGTFETDIIAAAAPIKSGVHRMVLVAARGAVDGSGAPAEVAAAAAGAIGGQSPASSMVLKKINGFSMPLVGQFSPTEIKALAADGTIPVIDPALVHGESLHFGDGVTNDLFYIDNVRLIDDVEFKLKASLIGLIGDARISRTGLAAVIRRAEGVLDQVKSTGAITKYTVIIPVYDALLKPEAARTAGEALLITDSRSARQVDMTIIIVIGPAVHQLKIALQPKY